MVSYEEKLDVISQLQEGEHTVGIRCYVKLTQSSVHTFCSNADRTKKVLSVYTNIKLTLNVNNLKQELLFA